MFFVCRDADKSNRGKNRKSKGNEEGRVGKARGQVKRPVKKEHLESQAKTANKQTPFKRDTGCERLLRH